MRVSERIVLGTRGSELARAQTQLVESALRNAATGLLVEVEVIRTRGDEKSGRAEAIDPRAGRKGLFTSEIERALLDGKIHVAVHSAKDLPSDATAGLEIAAALPRAPVEDVLVTKGDASLELIRPGGMVATGSVRRQNQLRWLRPDLNVPELRGNVPTRLRKLKANMWDGVVLARAGLERLGFDCARSRFSFEGEALGVAVLSSAEFLPAGGQGIIALQAQANDGETRAMLEKVNHRETLLSLRAEREFLRLLHGDCNTPVGVLAHWEAGSMTMRAQIFDSGSATPRAAELKQSRAGDTPESLAAELLELINGG